jgi:hypothetical protein
MAAVNGEMEEKAFWISDALHSLQNAFGVYRMEPRLDFGLAERGRELLL